MKNNFIILSFFLLFISCVFPLQARETPLLKVGIVSDTHVTPKPASCEWVRKAWTLFKQHKVDLVANCGDIADLHYPKGYRNYRQVINSLYPAGTVKPQELYVYANHDRLRIASIDEAFAAVKKHLEVPNDPYDVLHLKGYTFLTVPQNADLVRYEKMIVDALKKAPDKPLFIFDHIPPFETTSNTRAWGNIPRRQMLNKYPQVVHISGHTHNTLFNEQCIWQGEFTAVNAGSLHVWGGSLAGGAPERGKRATEVLIMEVFKDKILFRRYSLLNGREYRPDAPWCIPLPFKKETAPYNSKKRYARSPVPAFPAGSKLGFVPDAKPFNNLKLQFPAARPDVFIYNIAIERKNAGGKFEKYTEKEIFANFHLLPEQQLQDVETPLASGYFDSHREYRISVTPINFYGKKGTAISGVWRTPATAVNKVLFESNNPMKELSFKSNLQGGTTFKQVNGFYLHDTFAGRLIFPAGIWQIPAGTPLRLIADIHTIQNGIRQWSMVLRNPDPRRNAHPRVLTGQGDIRCRYIIDFTYQRKNFNYYLLIREGDTGKIRFNYIRLEQLPSQKGKN